MCALPEGLRTTVACQKCNGTGKICFLGMAFFCERCDGEGDVVADHNQPGDRDEQLPT